MKRTKLVTTVAVTVALCLGGGAAPASAVDCTMTQLVNTSAKILVSVNACSSGSKLRAFKQYYSSDASNAYVSTTYGAWASQKGALSSASLPTGKFHKINGVNFNL
ncbi:hypothetical protein GCM10022198_12540 [Klugiella xanthotipulae]|uniref:Beta/gamma crystallin n=1 Tax=Klugiella xanthotipulae TaxID=244735 RepID=A0A543I4D5_9MICO|nr:hypothetical protein FB466_0137 [Klugiella xanthotipulae]